MKTKKTAFFAIVAVIVLGQPLLGQAIQGQTGALSQPQPVAASPDGAATSPQGVVKFHYPTSIDRQHVLQHVPQAQPAVAPAGYALTPGDVMPASFCGGCGVGSPDACSCQSSGCSGACGGTCNGDCGNGMLGGSSLLGGTAFEGNPWSSNGGWWGSAEYLLWWSKQRDLPVLATTAPAGTPLVGAGALGAAGTQELFVNDEFGDGPHSGFRLAGGKWLDQERSYGIGTRFFFIEGSDDFTANSDQHPILAIPVFNVTTNAQDSNVIAFPGESTGRIELDSENRVYGFDFLLRRAVYQSNCNRLDFIGGYHHSSMEDTAKLGSFLVSQNPAGRVPVGGTFDTIDNFEVTNEFHGGFLGFLAEAEDGRLTWRLLAKVALGNMNQEAKISGSTVAAFNGASNSLDHGFLALPSNIGTFDRDEFAVIPELNLTVGYNINNNVQLTLGYNFMYWSNVALAGDLIDQSVNLTQINGALVGEARPNSVLVDDGYWYSGINIGGSVRF